MRITARVSYGLRALVILADRRDEPMKGEAIARHHDLSVGFLEVVLGELRRAGLVDSKRGGQGGYWLARPPDAITVADVIRVLDGESPSVPTPQGRDELAPVWRTLVDGYMDAAEQITVAGLATDH